MAFVKVQKNKAYCSRYQTKYRRRREGKTDYQARRRLVFQDKNKYDSKKYRFCVRRTCSKIICQVIFATLSGDRVMTSATSNELRAHGLTAGLTNYAAAYATGLLCARRLLALKKMDTMYEGQKKIDGKLYSVADNAGDRQPFKAHLDIGLVRATTGNRSFGAMKGAADGGLFVPHTEKRFPGFVMVKEAAVANKRGKAQEQEKAKSQFNAEDLKSHIFGGHVQSYYDMLKKEDASKFKKQFSQWEKCLAAAKVKNMEELYTKVHAAIRAKPALVKKAESKTTRKVVIAAPEAVYADSKGRKWLRQAKTASSVKRERIAKLMSQIKATICK